MTTAISNKLDAALDVAKANLDAAKAKLDAAASAAKAAAERKLEAQRDLMNANNPDYQNIKERRRERMEAQKKK